MAAGAGSGALLRMAWADRTRDRRAVRVAGWAGMLGTALLAMVVLGPVPGLAAALVAGSIGVLLLIWTRAERRGASKPRDSAAAPEPLGGRSRVWRGVLRAVLAGPLGLAAALGAAFAVAAWMPAAAPTRLLVSGLLVPVLWGMAMTWTLADQRLLRAVAVLVFVALAGYGVALLGRPT